MLWFKNREGQNGNLVKKSDFYSSLSLLPRQFSLSPLSLLPRDLGRATLRLPSDGPATTGQADLRQGYRRVRLPLAVTT